MAKYEWIKPSQFEQAKSFVCGFCGDRVGADRGYAAQYGVDPRFASTTSARICPTCTMLTFFSASGEQIPGPIIGSAVKHLPEDVFELWVEANRSFSSGATTATAMVCRVLLMHVAADQGAPDMGNFWKCVQFLLDEGLFAKTAGHALDKVRVIGNTANHDLVVIDQDTAETALKLVEHLLRTVYEIPGEHPASVES